MRAPNFYASAEVERLSERQRDIIGLPNDCPRRAAPCCYPGGAVYGPGGCHEAGPRAGHRSRADALQRPNLSGLWQRAYFAVDISHHEDRRSSEFGTYRDLRELA